MEYESFLQIFSVVYFAEWKIFPPCFSSIAGVLSLTDSCLTVHWVPALAGIPSDLLLMWLALHAWVCGAKPSCVLECVQMKQDTRIKKGQVAHILS